MNCTTLPLHCSATQNNTTTLLLVEGKAEEIDKIDDDKSCFIFNKTTTKIYHREIFSKSAYARFILMNFLFSRESFSPLSTLIFKLCLQLLLVIFAKSYRCTLYFKN